MTPFGAGASLIGSSPTSGRGGRPGSRCSPQRPVIDFTWLDEVGRELFVAVAGGEASSAVAGSVPSLHYAGILVARDAGIWLFILGSLGGSLGLALRLWFPDQAVHAACTAVPGGTRVRLTASTRFLPALHEEFIDGLLRKLTASPGKEASA